MHQVAKFKRVVIDESLVDFRSLLRARELGYSGVALKACKGQSNALLMAAAAQEFGMFPCVQDLTCPARRCFNRSGSLRTSLRSALSRATPASMSRRRTLRGPISFLVSLKFNRGCSTLPRSTVQGGGLSHELSATLCSRPQFRRRADSRKPATHRQNRFRHLR